MADTRTPEGSLPGGPAAAAGEAIAIDYELNGRPRSASVRADETLLELLRWHEHQTGTREGCGVGMCGACSVLVDDRLTSACLLLAAQLDGRRILTVEGLEDVATGNLNHVQQAYIDEGAFQCAYCTPGFVMATVALVAEAIAPDVEEVKAYLGGNLCRCGSYVKILAAAQLAATPRTADRGVA
jgi:aerobic-type carbon monoxide dehydrogenase small subunit (CoxS/CutS family)